MSVENLKQFLDNYKGDAEDLKCLNEATSLGEQISVLKQIIQSVNNGDVQNVDNLLELYTDILIETGLKSPLKIAVLKLLLTLSDRLKHEVKIKICSKFESKMSSSIEPPDVTECLSHLIFCMENAKKELTLVGLLGDFTCQYLIRSLQLCLKSLRNDSPPTGVLVIFNCIHTCTRYLIIYFQSSCSIPCTTLFSLVSSVLKIEQLPLNTKSNAGMLCVLFYKLIYKKFDLIDFEKKIDSTDDLVRLCTISGMLNVLDFDDLNIVREWNGKKVNFLTFVVNLVIEIEERHSAVCNLVLAASRCMELASKSVKENPELIDDDLISKFLSYSWAHLEHSMNAVRKLASTPLANLVYIGNQKKYILDAIINDVSKIPVEMRSNSVALTALIGSIPIADLLKNSPGLIDSLLLNVKKSSGVNHATSLYEKLMVQHFKEKCVIREWYSLWVFPVLKAISSESSTALEHILSSGIKVHCKVFKFALNDLDEAKWNSSRKLKIRVLRIGRLWGYLNERRNTPELWKEILPYETLLSSIKSRDDEERVMCFELLTDPQKRTECYEKEDISLIKSVLKYNINCRNLTERQKSFSVFEHFVGRLHFCCRLCELKISNKTENVEDELFVACRQFSRWIVDFLVFNLFPTANFLRREAALKMLDHCAQAELSLVWERFTDKVSHVPYILHCFLDSYEENRSLAKKLFRESMSFQIAVEKIENYGEDFFVNAVSMASSIRPPDCISAAYFVELILPYLGPNCMRKIYKKHFEEELHIPNQLKKRRNEFICLKILLSQLIKELDVAKRSLLRASCSGPMYGLIFTLRHILESFGLGEVEENEDWKELVTDIIKTCMECNQAVAFVVNNSSPEGLLPMDFVYDVSRLGLEEDVPHVTSQMVLLCCWRTVKEVSLLLGELSSRASITHPGPKPSKHETYSDDVDCYGSPHECHQITYMSGLLSEDQIISIGDHLRNLLLETKHRGAFEQAHVGFCKVVSRLWRKEKWDRSSCLVVGHPNLNEVAKQWLTETMKDISSNTELSATRRSAGIPFIVQALVCAELEGAVYEPTEGINCIKELLKLAEDKEMTVDTRAHALNILRALFRHSKLGEMVSPYVHQGLAIALNGFNSDNWTERNSSTLLLSALVTRVFGVPRTSDTENLSLKNKMTGRMFFLKYPSLFEALFKHLESAAKSDMYPAIYPVLLILGRLYLSSLEGTDSNLELNKFIPYVSKCAGSPVLKARSLAATAIVSLISSNIFVQHVDKCFEDLITSRNENLTHGLLLQVLKLVINTPEDCSKVVETRINVWMCVILHLLESGKHCYIVKESCLKVAYRFATHFFPFISKDNWDKLFGILEQTLFCPDGIIDIVNPDFGASGYFRVCTILLITLCYKTNNIKILAEKVTYLIHHYEYLVMQTCLKFITSILEKDELFIYEDVNDLDPLNLNCPMNKELCDEFINLKPLAKSVVDMLETKSHPEDKLLILETVKCLPQTFSLIENQTGQTFVDYMGLICDSEPDLMGAAAFHCIVKFLKIEDNLSKSSEKDFDKVCSIIREYSNIDADFECRMSVKSLFENKFNDLIQKAQHKNACIILTTELKLLSDDDDKVRIGSSLSSIEEFFSSIPNVLNDRMKMLCILLAWAMGDCSLEDQQFNEINDQVFEKGDTNRYSEEVMINRLSCDQLSLLFKADEILQQKIPQYLLEWIQEETCIDTDSDTAKEIVAHLKNRITSITDSIKQKTPFRPMETKLFSMEIKLNNILQALGEKYNKQLFIDFN